MRAQILIITAVISLAFFSCAGGGGDAGAPLWVLNKEAAYPDREWLGFVEQGANRNAAETAAMNTLAQSFRVDIRSVTEAQQTLASQISTTNRNSIRESAEYQRFAQNVTLHSQVSGLIGVETDVWTERGGMVYAIARMNRAACSARYRDAIDGNEKLIALVKQKAEETAGSFESLVNISLAEAVAEQTDAFYAILSVLDRQAAGQGAAYGSAAEVRLLKRAASQLLTVEMRVRDDSDGRIDRAFSAVLSERGFVTGGEKPGRYVLEADFRLEDAVQGDDEYVFVWYTLEGVLRDRDGTRLVDVSETDREGHLSQQDAEQRAIRAAERVIAGKGFAEKLDACLDSLR